jgi:hypothetical protein
MKSLNIIPMESVLQLWKKLFKNTYENNKQYRTVQNNEKEELNPGTRGFILL